MADLEVLKTDEHGRVEGAETPSTLVVNSSYTDIALSPQMHKEAISRGVNLSHYLEDLDDSKQYAQDPLLGRMDAFERQLYRTGIVTRSDLTRGMHASMVGDFYNHRDVENAEVLFPEFIARVWRSVAVPVPQAPVPQGYRFYASSSPVSDVLHPDYIQTVVRQKQIEPPVPLSEIIAITTPVDTDAYRAFYLTDSETDRQMVRTGEGSEFGTVTLTGADHTINLKKYGRRILISYETIRRIRVDRLALHLALLAVQAEVDKVGTAVDIAINGDGNASTAATSYNLTALDAGAAAGTPSLQSYLALKLKYDSPYNGNVLLAREAHIMELLMCNAGTGNVMYLQAVGKFGIGGVTLMNDYLAPVRIGKDTTVAAERWLMLDNRFALEMVTEIGATLTETNRIINGQFDEIVISEVVGFCVFDAEASKIVVLNA